MVDAIRVSQSGMEELWGPENNTEENMKAYSFFEMNIEEDQIWPMRDSLNEWLASDAQL